MQLFAIRHKPTGALMPQFPRGGHTWWEPGGSTHLAPRIFASHKRAYYVIVQYVRGRAQVHYERNGGVSGAEVLPETERDPRDYEVVCFLATEVFASSRFSELKEWTIGNFKADK